ncbi:MAG: hypothetical protein M3R13_10945 [Armatimonadota bacterium]|nr:hypothetical protein [Armatimonadota bacterium]
MKLRFAGPSDGARRALVGLTLAVLAISASAQTPKKSVAFFPFGLGEEVMQTQGFKLDEAITTPFGELLQKDGRFTHQFFKRTHASVRRALMEGSLKSALLLEPYSGRFENAFKAVTLGKVIRADFAVAGHVDAWSYDAATKKAKMTVSIETYDVSLAKPLGAVVLTVESTGDTEADAAKDVAKALAAQAVPQVLTILATPPKKDGGDGTS